MERLAIILLVLFGLFGCSDPKPDPNQLDPGDQGTIGWSPIFAPVPEQQPCTPAQQARILDTNPDPTVVNCHLTLTENDTVTRPLVIRSEQSSGVNIDCNGATISVSDGDALRIRSEELVPVHDVTISNCNVQGSVRIWGLGVNGDNLSVESSRELEHVQNVRDHAPYNITLDNVNITGQGRIPLYFGPGTHHCTIQNSEISGDSVSVLIYLDAESTYNNILNNTLRGQDIWREAIAVDASSNNTITDNSIWSVYFGGIYLYRNCGEGGVIRHTTPSDNIISGNIISGRRSIMFPISDPGIYLGSRDGSSGYCDDDAGYEYGSSISNYDHARRNVVSNNDLRSCEIEIGNTTNFDNIIE